MTIKQKNGLKTWLLNLYYISTSLTLFFIMAQVFLAKRSMIQSGEWEKAKLTIDNIERFREHLKESTLYDKTEDLLFADRLWADFTTHEGWNLSDPLRIRYFSLFENQNIANKEADKILSTLDAFAYPIIMGYANEFVSYQIVIEEYNPYANYIMPLAFSSGKQKGQSAKLLYRLWRVRAEQSIFKMVDSKISTFKVTTEDLVNYFTENIKYLLCFEGTEVTPASIKQYEKKIEKELEKIQKEIEDFRKSSLK